MEGQYLVFVYGSLRRGHLNHALIADAFCVGTGVTDLCFAMYLVSGYPYVTSTEARYPIVGELYAIDFDILDIIDKMEGHPHYYVRRETAVTVGGAHFTAWMYFRDRHGTLMPNGDYNSVAPNPDASRMELS